MNTVSESKAAWDMASEEFIADTENLAAWIESARTDRQPSPYFGMISNAELLTLIFSNSTQADAEARYQAIRDIRVRFFAENAELIALEAEKLQRES